MKYDVIIAQARGEFTLRMSLQRSAEAKKSRFLIPATP